MFYDTGDSLNDLCSMQGISDNKISAIFTKL